MVKHIVTDWKGPPLHTQSPAQLLKKFLGLVALEPIVSTFLQFIVGDGAAISKYTIYRTFLSVAVLYGLMRLAIAKVGAIEAQLLRDRDELEAVINGMSNGLIILDRHADIRVINPQAAAMLGFENPVGRNVRDLATECELEDGRDASTGRMLSLRALRGENQPPTLIRAKRTGKWVRIVNRPIWSSGQVVAAFSICTDMTEARQHEQDLKRAIAVREEFISLASHELKTPLTSIKMATQLNKKFFEQGRLDDAKLKHLFGLWLGQLDRFEGLITDMLDMTSINIGRLPLHRTMVDLDGLLRTITKRFPEQVQCEGAKVTGMWDAHRIEQIVLNLITNGIKYGLGKPVRVRLTRDGDSAVMRVSDEGIGIAPKDLERVFMRFERVNHEGTVGGLGLGLYIVKQIVDAKGGSISIDSTPGKGSTFTVTLPIQVRK